MKPQSEPQSESQSEPPLLRVRKGQADAACRGSHGSVRSSPHGERGHARRRREESARAVRRRSPASDPCRLFAMTTPQGCGIRGGRTEAEHRPGPGSVHRPARPEGKGRRFTGSPGAPLPVSVAHREAEPS